jgi:Secretion system C-terminal sorting domain/Cytochrome c552
MEEIMRKSFLLILFALLSFSTIYSQTVTLESYGVSPRDVEVDTSDIFDIAFNGMVNVGKETQMYLMGSSSDSFTGGTWTLLTKPSGSATTMGTATVADTSTEYLVFVPDVVGTYKVSFMAGGMGDTLTINAGTYLGMTGGNVGCVTCHSSEANDYAETGHATALVRGLNGMKGDHFAAYCVSCHTTGYDANADNDGFDDFDFIFPDSLFDGQYDNMVAAYPDAMDRANIQCESCHGPGSEHMGNIADNKMISNLDVKNCAVCHDAGTHHVYPAQWAASGQDATEFDGRGFHGGHAAGAFVSYAGGRGACAPCHSGAGYVQWDKEGKPTDGNGLPTGTEVLPESVNISCAVCHDPHVNNNEHQLRLSDTQLGDGTPITFEKYGTGAQCMECHRSRRYAVEYASDPNSGSSHFGPHHGPQADMLIGANAPDFGVTFPSSPHAVAGENSCVDCHMAGEEHVDDDGNPILVGGHSFNMNDALGNDHIEACTPCHGEVGETFKEKKYFLNSDADHDGDGVEEGLQEEVHGMLETLATYLPEDADGNVDMSSKTNAPAVVRAGYAYMWVEEDRSFGIHNPAFTVALLQVAIESMKYGALDAGKIQEVSDIPMDQGNQVRVVWTAFSSDDGVAADQVDSYVIMRQVASNPDLWDDVATIKAIRYVEYSAVVPTLHNTVEGDTVLSTFKVAGITNGNVIAETDPMSGYSTDDLAPAVPGNVALALNDLNVVITWDKPVDEDFNYFEVYRSETQGFMPSADNMLTTTIEDTYSDSNVELGRTYFYKVAATDFSRNRSAASEEVNLTITGVDDAENVPTEYSLNQNYPNPFNPSTTIQFGIPETSDVQITIYDMVGNTVEVLVNDNLNAGYHTYTWNASNHASGIYFLQMTTSKFTSVNKMLLVK